MDAARSLLAQSLQRCPDHAESYQAWAMLEGTFGDFDKARIIASEGQSGRALLYKKASFTSLPCLSSKLVSPRFETSSGSSSLMGSRCYHRATYG
jgi:hypothetical protein